MSTTIRLWLCLFLLGLSACERSVLPGDQTQNSASADDPYAEARAEYERRRQLETRAEHP